MIISVNCPSYKRTRVETLDYLPFCRVWVDPSEADEYRRQNEGADIIECDEGVQGNVCRVRNHILNREFARGVDVVCIVDDDIKGIYHFEAAGQFGYLHKKIAAADFEKFIIKYSIMAQDIGAYLWGVNLNFDKLAYRHSLPFNTNGVILGPFSCHMRGSEIRYDEALPLKEDYDLSLQHLNKYRVVLRINKYHYMCKQSEQAGGCAAYRNMDREREQFEALRRKWGDDIIRYDKSSKKAFDYNPKIYIPIKGV